ncbi:DUF916 and DUF3324 domain-containing protein [Vagococcus lutrae]|uniref:DUF916 and DUF3324 domain-containing protein n=1 Tax=Vagococcus lutrae TaxID=81947 RepID=UPI00200DBA39|nr:DUF916 and DUF3324 domain-containing protein [Vagococcus lutrae]UQF37549.1 DUF916 and DUF3324 domain-containing protein [Vagococcus lutrae]
MSKKNRIKLLILFVMLVNWIGMTTSLADTYNFSAQPIQPDTQVDKEQSYFDIKVEPEKEQELVVKLFNDSDKDIKVNTSISSSTTNSNGVVEYSPNDIKKDDTLRYDLADLVETEEQVVIPKKSFYDLKLKVIPPKETFEGIIAGGITLKEEKEKEEEKEEGNGLAIKNEYAYVIAIIMHSDNNQEVEPELNLNKVYPDQINARNAIITRFQNPKPTYINNVVIATKIKKDGKKEPFVQEEKQNMQIAPNTTFNYPVIKEGKKLEAGNYVADITVYANKNNDGEHEYGKDEEGNPVKYQDKWTYSEKFSISKEKARELNKKDVTLKPDYTNWYIIGGLIIIILALIISLYFSRRNKNEKKAE